MSDVTPMVPPAPLYLINEEQEELARNYGLDISDMRLPAEAREIWQEHARAVTETRGRPLDAEDRYILTTMTAMGLASNELLKAANYLRDDDEMKARLFALARELTHERVTRATTLGVPWTVE